MNAELTTVHIMGAFGHAIGHRQLDLDVKSVPEALRALNVITRGKMERYLSTKGRDRLYRIAIQQRDNVLDTGELTHRTGRSAIFIIPTIRGRNSGLGKVIAGIGLLALTYFTGGLAAGAIGWAGAGATAAAGIHLSFLGAIAVGFGTSLILGGITQALTPAARGPDTPTEQAQSTSFAGNASAVVQGGCVPVVYGRALVSAVPIMISTTNNDVSVSSGGTSGSVDTTLLPGGGQQYAPGDDVPIGELP